MEFKEAIVKKSLLRGEQSLEGFCRDNNLNRSNVSRWIKECGNDSCMMTKKKKTTYSAEQILNIISETHSLNEEALGIYLRKNGLYSHQLTQWKEEIVLLFNQPKVSSNKKDERDLRIKDLERNLKKKDAALAEASALLILQKKIQLIWPMEKEDEES